MSLRGIVDEARGDVPCAVVLRTGEGVEAVSATESVDEPRFIGSVTKLFVAKAIRRMVALGRMELDDETLALVTHGASRGAYEYSNDGYDELGRRVAAAAGLPFAKAIHDHVCMPWNLVRTTFPTRALKPPELTEANYPSGGLRSTARELAAFAWRHEDFLGWKEEDFDGARVFLHGGHVAGRSAIVAAIPARRAALAVLCGPEVPCGVIWGSVMRERLGLIQR